ATLASNAQNGPIITVGTVTTQGTTTTVGLTAQNFNDIWSGDIKILYDNLIASATSVTVNPLLGGGYNTNLTTPGVLKVGWYQFVGITVPDGTEIFTLTFDRVALGTTPLTFLDD